MSNLISSAPGIYAALLRLVEAAAAEQQPPVNVFSFELGQYEPASYILISEIANHEWEWETIGYFQQKERYEVRGKATIFTGDTPAQNPEVALSIMQETYALHQTCVMGPVMSNRTRPMLGNTSPSPSAVYSMLPSHSSYTAGPAQMGGRQAGWAGVLDWGIRFEALITPN